MTEEGRTLRQRIVVALREDRGALAALEAAARLAADLSAELVGLYIEDEEAVQAATLPVTSLISSTGGLIEPVDATLVRRSLRVQARRLEHELARVAGSLGVPWSFAQKRGRLAEQILQSTTQSDILALTAPGTFQGTDLSAVSLMEVTRRATCSLYFVRRAPKTTRSICILSTGSPRTLALGVTIAKILQRPLYVQPVSQPEDAEKETAPADQLSANRLVTLLEPISADPAQVVARLKRLAPGHVVVNRKCLRALNLEPSDLTSQLQLESLIVTDDAQPG